jgi:hypothetical protein
MRNFLYLSAAVLIIGCNPNRRDPAVVDLAECPSFNADSAYSYLEKQLEFGPRVPTTIGHQQCGDYIASQLKTRGGLITEQVDTVIGYDKKRLPLRNIMGAINPSAKRRIMLCAHWDSRPFMDQDTVNVTDSLVGANDNASGVSVLLEISRLLVEQPPSIGVDLVFFDMEDQGRPAYETASDPNDYGYCLGSIYWAENVPNEKPEYGILVDMVGAKDAIFALESISFNEAKEVLYKVWDMGHQLGYTEHFQYNRTQAVYDDHKYINELAGIPCIDIIDHDATTPSEFGKYWHTHADNLELIDRETLKAVGQTLTQLIYNEPGL